MCRHKLHGMTREKGECHYTLNGTQYSASTNPFAANVLHFAAEQQSWPAVPSICGVEVEDLQYVLDYMLGRIRRQPSDWFGDSFVKWFLETEILKFFSLASTRTSAAA